MKIQGLEKLSLVDFDGYAAATVFLAGCNLRCPFCQNAALVEGDVPDCISESEFFAFLDKRSGLLDAVCISGGEPTLRRELPDFCRAIKEKGYLVKLDTNGTSPEMLKQLIREKLIDYVAMDVKAPLYDYESLLLAEPNAVARVKESIELLICGTLPYEFRTTLVSEMIDEKGIADMADLLRGAKKLFLQKFEDRGGNLAEGLTAVPLETAKLYQEILSKEVEQVALRGYT
jgi:pyruvate formate lyase activating enzyme